MNPDRLARLLGDPELAWLIQRIRRRLADGDDLTGSVTLSRATPAQREAVARLLGRRPGDGATLTVSLPAVDRLLRDSSVGPQGLADAVVALTGPVLDRARQRAESEQAWANALVPLADRAQRRPALRTWLHRVQATGLVRRLASDPDAAAVLLREVTLVLDELPARGEPLGRFAARTLTSAHALDTGLPRTTLVLGALRALADLPDTADPREVWASAGLHRDDLSSRVLVLGLPGDSHSSTGRMLAIGREAGEPLVLTLRQLVRDPPRGAPPLVSVCENPAVVGSAAARLGPDCAPLVCTSGQPSAATMILLRILAGRGARLRYHGDFDWDGLRIANVLFDRLTVAPWRFTAADYRVVAQLGHPLTGRPSDAVWDTELGSVMRTAERAVEEELVLDELLDDLND